MDRIPTQDELEAVWISPAKGFRGEQTTARTVGTTQEITHITQQGEMYFWQREVGETEWKLIPAPTGKFDAKRP